MPWHRAQTEYSTVPMRRVCTHAGHSRASQCSQRQPAAASGWPAQTGGAGTGSGHAADKPTPGRESRPRGSPATPGTRPSARPWASPRAAATRRPRASGPAPPAPPCSLSRRNSVTRTVSPGRLSSQRAMSPAPSTLASRPAPPPRPPGTGPPPARASPPARWTAWRSRLHGDAQPALGLGLALEARRRAALVVGGLPQAEGHLQPHVREDGVVQLLRGAHRPVEEGRQVHARHLGRGLSPRRPRDAGAVAMALPQQPQDIIQALRVAGGAADLQVQQRAHHLALEVVGDGAVGGVLVRPVVLHPAHERRLRERLHAAARGGVQQGERLAQPGR